MNRINPLLLAVIATVLICAGLLSKIEEADDCMDKGEVVIAPMSRNQHCPQR